ncbi:hypothetical protein D3C78_1253690 [compost metagenome]
MNRVINSTHKLSVWRFRIFKRRDYRCRIVLLKRDQILRRELEPVHAVVHINAELTVKKVLLGLRAIFITDVVLVDDAAIKQLLLEG